MKISLRLLSALLLLGCSFPGQLSGLSPHPGIGRQDLHAQTLQPAKWTVLVYLAGDNDLEEYVVKDLENELGHVGSSAQVQVLALADRTPGYDSSRGDWTSTKLFHITPGMRADARQARADWGERNMGDPLTLIEFVNWAKVHYPAERYALYFWGHGWNWHPGYIMEDKTNQDALDPHELKAILPQLGQIDLVAYDGCNMGSIEVETLWHGHATAIAHSQEFVDWDGIEYDVVLKELQKNPGMTADQLAILTSRSASLNQERTGSAVALDQRFADLLKAVDVWSVALIQGLPRYKAQYARAFDLTQHFEEAPDEKDLFHLATLLEQGVPDPQIKAASRAVLNALQKVILTAWHRPDYPQAHGISISVVAAHDEYLPYYRQSDFARLTHWDEFLAAYHQ